jgi:hypothetical protein
MVTDTALKRIAEASGVRYVRVALSQPAGLGLDIASAEATETLHQLGADRARDAALQEQLAAFFAN